MTSRKPQPPLDPVASIAVPEVRDYARINAEAARLLDLGHRRVRLAGVDGQRLLLAGLRGPWDSVVELEGDCGPELAAGLDAPGLRVVALGSAADGAGRGLRRGRVLVSGDAGVAVGCGMDGGVIVVAGRSGPRAGLGMAGGVLVLVGCAESLAGERQSGGLIAAMGTSIGPNTGYGRRGGSFLTGDDLGSRPEVVRAALDDFVPWLGEEADPITR